MLSGFLSQHQRPVPGSDESAHYVLSDVPGRGGHRDSHGRRLLIGEDSPEVSSIRGRFPAACGHTPASGEEKNFWIPRFGTAEGGSVFKCAPRDRRRSGSGESRASSKESWVSIALSPVHRTIPAPSARRHLRPVPPAAPVSTVSVLDSSSSVSDHTSAAVDQPEVQSGRDARHARVAETLKQLATVSDAALRSRLAGHVVVEHRAVAVAVARRYQGRGIERKTTSNSSPASD